jgi:hypothetical protein
MTKKQELKALLDSDFKKTMSQSASKILEQTIKKYTRIMEDEPMKTEPKKEQKQTEQPIERPEKGIDQIIENPVMLEYQLSEAEEKKIQDIEPNYFINILNVIPTKNDKATTTFNKDDVITFHIICSATEMFSKLSADFRIEAIAQDLSNFLPQKIYCFSYESKLRYPHFEIVFETKAVLKGIFRFQVIFTIGQVDFFNVYDNCIYRVL